MSEKEKATDLGTDSEDQGQLPEPTHRHECMDREDEVCGKRGHCVCQCGATTRFWWAGVVGTSEWHP